MPIQRVTKKHMNRRVTIIIHPWHVSTFAPTPLTGVIRSVGDVENEFRIVPEVQSFSYPNGVSLMVSKWEIITDYGPA